MPTYRGRPSTDGTYLGALIAEVMGTDDEEEIIRQAKLPFNSDIDPEQQDWESDDADNSDLRGGDNR